MRNALVLVPLCIGVTCGFIVPTSTSEGNNFTKSTLKEKIIAIDEEIIKKYSTDSIDLENGVKRDIYKEGSEENKNIEERSFILVNKGWSKQPYKSYLVDTKLTNSMDIKNFKNATSLSVFQAFSRYNVVPEAGYFPTNKTRNKSYSTSTHIESKIHSIHSNHSNHHIKNNEVDKQNYFIDLLKPLLIRPLIKSYENTALHRNIKNKRPDNADKKHFMDVNKENHNIEAYKNNDQKVTEQHEAEIENTSFYNDKIQDIVDDSNVETVTEQKLFHLLLEEQVPRTQAIYKYNNSSLGSLNYCRKCLQLAKLSKLGRVNSECDCKCGRYIYLKGREESKHQAVESDGVAKLVNIANR